MLLYVYSTILSNFSLCFLVVFIIKRPILNILYRFLKEGSKNGTLHDVIAIKIIKYVRL